MLFNLLLSLVIIIYSVIFYLFPDQFFAMKIIGYRLQDKEQIKKFDEFRKRHRDNLSLWKFLVICLACGLLAFISLTLGGEVLGVIGTIIAGWIPLWVNVFFLTRTWREIEVR